MQIFDKEPSDWQDLQVKVGKLLTDLNFSVQIEKEIKTARDTVNVDVVANYNSFPKECILVECKYWHLDNSSLKYGCEGFTIRKILLSQYILSTGSSLGASW